MDAGDEVAFVPWRILGRDFSGDRGCSADWMHSHIRFLDTLEGRRRKGISKTEVGRGWL